MQEIIKKWNEANISYAEFQFSCGGDSMNDTSLSFYDVDGNVVDESGNLESYFEDEVYKNVQFYEASDGHYIGESGYVRIELSDEGDEFYYTKSAEAEWSENKSGEVLVPITDEEFKILDEYILGMANSNWNGASVDYKKDFILTDELEVAIKDLQDKFENHSYDFQPETGGEVEDESHRFNTTNEDTMQMEFVYVDDVRHLKLFVECNCIEYTDSED
jgi:hypothetical protein